MIQGSLSLDDEREHDCTVILPACTSTSWPGRRSSRRGGVQRAFVHRITPTLWTRDDAQRFGTEWTPQPHLPHGASSPAKKARRTLLPWFVGQRLWRWPRPIVI